MAETIPGGIYKSANGTYHDAHGRPVAKPDEPLDPVPASDVDLLANALQVHKENAPPAVVAVVEPEKPHKGVKASAAPAPDGK